MSSSVLQVQQVSFRYGGKEIFRDLSLSIQEREFVSIVGPSGSGKTTLFRLLLGLEKPETGGLFLGEKQVIGAGGGIAYVPQKDLLIPWRSILDNVILPLEISGLTKREAYANARPHFASFGLAGTESAYPHMLSGGMKQRVSFLRAYLTGSDVLLLDEPFSALDAISRVEMQDWLLEQWVSLKKTIILITHDLDEALLLSDRILVTSSPPMKQLAEIPVPLSRPRTMDMKLDDKSLLSLKSELLQKFRHEGAKCDAEET